MATPCNGPAHSPRAAISSSLFASGARPLVAIHYDGIELVVNVELAVDIGVNRLGGRNLLLADQAGEFFRDMKNRIVGRVGRFAVGPRRGGSERRGDRGRREQARARKKSRRLERKASC